MAHFAYILAGLIVPMAYMHGYYYSQTLPLDLPKVANVTNLHFYMHEIQGVGNETDTVVTVASQDNNRVSVVDDYLTVGSDFNSQLIGNAKGLSVTPSNRDGVMVGVLYLDFGFTSGEFSGSSISVFSRNTLTETIRELAVVGGRGKFRMAAGYALNTVYFMNETHFTLEFNMTIIHY